jgi:hypothetical protein
MDLMGCGSEWGRRGTVEEWAPNADKATRGKDGLLVWHPAPHPILADSQVDLFSLFNAFPFLFYSPRHAICICQTADALQ